MPVLLTDKLCQTIKSPKARTDYFDSKTSGLMLRVTPKGVKTFALQYLTPEGKRREVRQEARAHTRAHHAD